ncbi:hypothetical protein AOLI_G00291350 [Acnodon oligacanthus]
MLLPTDPTPSAPLLSGARPYPWGAPPKPSQGELKHLHRVHAHQMHTPPELSGPFSSQRPPVALQQEDGSPRPRKTQRRGDDRDAISNIHALNGDRDIEAQFGPIESATRQGYWDLKSSAPELRHTLIYPLPLGEE